MQNEPDRELAAQVDDLLSGSLPPDGREELLLRIARATSAMVIPCCRRVWSSISTEIS